MAKREPREDGEREEFLRRRRARNIALLVALLALVAIFYALTIVRVGDRGGDEPMPSNQSRSSDFVSPPSMARVHVTTEALSCRTTPETAKTETPYVREAA